ncbi:MAG: prolipoprotein diacylglyceryl transferase [Gammaproteobacteria bacterium]|nr:prolipoprotein diacylglyceryl transferase [Gammaproteobacteria bacterium]
MIVPDINPVAIQLGPLKVHWYGLMYLAGFASAWWVGQWRARHIHRGWKPEEVGDLIFYFALSIIIGGRLGYVLFYNPAYYFNHPLEAFFIWTGGMSFHGGTIGALAGFYLYARHTGRNMVEVADFSIVLVPLGLFFGRIGNFINQELWGKVTDMPWGMVFRTGGPLPRHPSMLYEAVLEGLVLFVILWMVTRKPRPMGTASGVFLVGYGVFRWLVELVRVPDAHIGYLAFDWLTMGQVLSLPMIVGGVALIWWAHRKQVI